MDGMVIIGHRSSKSDLRACEFKKKIGDPACVHHLTNSMSVRGKHVYNLVKKKIDKNGQFAE